MCNELFVKRFRVHYYVTIATFDIQNSFLVLLSMLTRLVNEVVSYKEQSSQALYA